MSTNFCDINTTLKEWATVVNSTIHFGETTSHYTKTKKPQSQGLGFFRYSRSNTF